MDWTEVGGALVAAVSGAVARHFGGAEWEKRRRPRKNSDPPPRPKDDPLGGKPGQTFQKLPNQHEELMSALRAIQAKVDSEAIRAESDRESARLHRDRQIEELREIRQLFNNALQRFIEHLSREH